MKDAFTYMDDIDNLLDGLGLLKACERYEPGFGFICKAKDIGLDSFVQCQEKDSHLCVFSIRYAHSYFCKSPARVHAAKLRR